MPQTTERTGKRRLLKLAALLEVDAKNKKGVKFDLRTWGGVADVADDAFNDPPPARLEPNCNTTACAVGLACLSGAFRRQGLRWRPSNSENNIIPIFGRLVEWSAVESFFAITPEASTYLFAFTSYRAGPTIGADGEREVAKRIREYVKGI